MSYYYNYSDELQREAKAETKRMSKKGELTPQCMEI